MPISAALPNCKNNKGAEMGVGVDSMTNEASIPSRDNDGSLETEWQQARGTI